jgi:autotransporter-associated beta strand protein
MKTLPQSVCAACLLAAAMLFPARFAQAADSSWAGNYAGNWTASGNWTNGVPGSNSTTTSTDIATFGFTLTSPRTVTVDTNRNIGGITFSNTSAFGYTLSGGSLILSNGGVIQTAAANGAHTDTISSGITLAGNATFTAGATNATSLLRIGAVTGSATTGNTTTLTLNGSSTAANAIDGVIGNGANGGKLAIVKDGAGTWVLNGANTFTGGLTVNSGTLYGRVNSNAFGTGAFTMTGGTVSIGVNQSGFTSSSLSGTVTLLSDANNPGTAGAQYGFGGPATAIANNAVVNIGVGPNVTSGTASFNLNGMNTAGNATFNIQNAVVNGTTVTGRLWLQNPSTFAAGTVTVTGNGQLFFNSGVTGSGGLTLDSNFTGSVIAAVSLGHTGPTVINSGTLQIGNGANQGTLNSATVITNNGTLIWNRVGASAQIISNGITGTGSVLLTGGGTSGQTNNVRLEGNNTYTGNTTISFGTLSFNGTGRLENSAIILSGTAVSVLDVSTMVGNTPTIKSLSGVAGSSVTLGSKTLLVGDSTSTTYAGALSGAGGGLTKQGSGTMTLSGNNTYTGATTVSAGTLQFAKTASLYNGTTANWTAANIRAGSGTTLAFNVGGTGEFTTGNVTSLLTNLAASSNSTNGMNAGAILGFDTTNASGGTFAIADVIADTTGASGGARALAKLGTGTLALSGNNTYTGATTINAGTLQIGAGGASGALSTSSAITNNGTLVFNRSGTLTQGTDFASGISGTGNLTQAGPGNLIITAANSYTGATTVANGTLTLSGSGTLGTSTITITGGTLDLGGSSITNTFSSITGGTISNGTLTNNGGNYALQNGTVSANLAGTNGVNKTTSGTVTLNGANTYTGTTTVSSGTLTAAASGAMGNSTVINVTGGSFLVTAANAVSDSTNINLDGGTLAMSGNFSENVGLLTLSRDSIIDFAGFSGVLRFSGVGSWAAGANLAIWNWSGVPRYGDPVNNYATPSNLVFTNNSTLTSNLSNISFYSDSGNSFVGSGFEVSGFSGGGSEIIAVPEPEAFFYAVALLAGLAVQYLRRRAKRKAFEGHRPA